jgi:hypothetical protein
VQGVTPARCERVVNELGTVSVLTGDGVIPSHRPPRVYAARKLSLNGGVMSEGRLVAGAALTAALVLVPSGSY